MNIIQSYTTLNPCYTNKVQIQIKGIVLHSVGCAQPSASVFVKQFNNSSLKKAVHAFIQPDGTVYQTLPWNFKAWHVGGNANATHIGVEMTEPSTIKYTSGANWVDLKPTETANHVAKTYQQSVQLFAYLCKLYSLNPLKDGVILSHSECAKRGLGSSHADVEHIWSKYGITMNQFRNDVAIAMGNINVSKVESSTQATTSTTDLSTSNTLYRVRKSWDSPKSQIGAYKSLQSAKEMADSQGGYKVYDANGNLVYTGKITTEGTTISSYRVRVTATKLNVRSTPTDGVSTNIVGSVLQGEAFTIVEENNGFGRLKSGVGWISLAYTEKV